MADLYITDNDDGSFLTFNKRVVYNYDIFASTTAFENVDFSDPEYKNLVDFNFGEKFLYGRVTRNFIPIFLDNPSSAALVPLDSTSIDGPAQSAVNFVVDAFQDLKQQFQKAVADGKLDPGHPYLSVLNVFKSFVNPIDLFNEHQDTYTSAIENHFSKNKIHVRNFQEFMHHLKLLLQKTVPSYPFTFSAYVKSKYCPINASGLAIEIADLDYFNDQQKIENFVASPHWKYFLNACRSYGFMVDKNIPWRIVADIGSPEMLEYGAAYKLSTTDRILNIGYTRADYIYYQKFRMYLHRLYKLVKLDKIPVVEKCNGRLKTTYVIPDSYSEEKLSNIFDDKKVLKFLFEIRMNEEPKKFSESEQKRIMRDCLSIYDSIGPSRASIVFERIINHPFDYNGSLSYIMKRRKETGEPVVLSKPRR
jgi:hypothetical protein